MLWLLICVAVLVMRVAGVHVHMCLDGQEPPQSLHWGDAGVHDDEDHASGSHADFEIDLLDEALAKNLPPDLDLPALLVAALVLLSPVLKSLAQKPSPSTIHPPSVSHFFRPLLRAPPL